MARINSGTVVAGLTAAALVVVAVLAVQASGSAPGTSARAPGPSTSATRPPSTRPTPKTYPLPAGSGTGTRVVYSVSGRRVWLVGDGGRVLRTFPVVAGSTAPGAGTHRVFFRKDLGVGGDGVPVEHVVLFATTGSGVNVGFSAPVSGTLDRIDPAQQGAAIREQRTDGAALWELATIGSTVQVVQ